jgi:hypothetical protein
VRGGNETLPKREVEKVKDLDPRFRLRQSKATLGAKEERVLSLQLNFPFSLAEGPRDRNFELQEFCSSSPQYAVTT